MRSVAERHTRGLLSRLGIRGEHTKIPPPQLVCEYKPDSGRKDIDGRSFKITLHGRAHRADDLGDDAA